jgi:hypothetical protein
MWECAGLEGVAKLRSCSGGRLRPAAALRGPPKPCAVWQGYDSGFDAPPRLASGSDSLRLATELRFATPSKPAHSHIFILLLVVVPAFVAAKPSTSNSYRVRIVRYEPGTDPGPRGRLSVTASFGKKKLYQTPKVPASRPEWGKSLRASTVKNAPLRFKVLAHGKNAALAVAPKAPTPLEDPDGTLATGLDDFVADYGTGTLDEGTPQEPERPGKKAGKKGGKKTVVWCRAELAWPPADGEHVLACGSGRLIVTSRKK